jgi:hypothetical protein
MDGASAKVSTQTLRKDRKRVHRAGGRWGGVDPSAAPLNVCGSPAGLNRLSGDKGTTEGAELEAAFGWDRGGETR